LGDPQGYLRNQIGHAYVVGGGLALILPLWSILLGYAVWEAVQWRYFGSEPWDGLEDAAHVMLIACAVGLLIPQLVIVHALFLGAGFLRRRAERDLL
jgi:hypothetical protein